MAKKSQLKITGASVEPAMAAREAGAAPTVQAPARAEIQVQNLGNEPLHVWSSLKAYEYDAASRKLTLYLTEHTPPPPPGIEMISDHPRTPHQVVVAPGASATIEVRLPQIIRRRVPGEGLGMSFVEELIGPIEQLEAHLQSATTPVKIERGESPSQSRARLRELGETVRSTIRLTGSTKKER